MINKLLILCFSALLFGCSNQKLTRQDTVTGYYSAFDLGNYNEIRASINDTITITSGDHITPYTHESFYEFFKWDSIFGSSYDIRELEEKNGHVLLLWPRTMFATSS